MEDGTLPLAPGWLVQLTGHDFDLRHWERSLKPPYDPWCERIPNGENFIFSLRSHRFVHAQSADEVRERAMPLIERLNGALGVVADAEPLNFQGVLRIDDQGGLHFFVFLEDHVRTRDAIEIVGVTDANGNLIPPPPPEPSAAQVWVEAAEQDEDIADMLIFAGRADNWFDIYKAIELAERLSGGKHELPKLLGVSRVKCQNMRETANFYRHARTHRPKVLTDLMDAKPLLSFIVRTVLARRVS
jgi:hypothetical protein